jgi:hypothetical protein
MIGLVDSLLEFSFGNWGTGLLAFFGVVLLFGLTVCCCVASSPYSRRSRSRRVMVPDDFYWSVNAPSETTDRVPAKADARVAMTSTTGVRTADPRT